MKLDTVDLAAQIFASSCISFSEYEILVHTLAQDRLDDQERTLIKRILYGVRHGMFRVIR